MKVRYDKRVPCPVCQKRILRDQGAHLVHDTCIIDARSSWADAYPSRSEDEQAAMRKAASLRFLRMNGTPMGGRGA